MPTKLYESQPLSRRKRFLFAAIIWTVIIVAFLSVSEIVLRRRLGPWQSKSAGMHLQLEPAKPYYQKDIALGYKPEPGMFRITLPGPYSFTITHSSDGLRITHPPLVGNGTKEIWIFGCSVTEGWSINDEQTYPWILQSRIKSNEVRNFGTAGYSTLQSLIQFRQALESGKRPALVVLSYAFFHDPRNTLTRSWMKTWMTNGPVYYLRDVQLPYMKWSADGKPKLLYQPLEYNEVPLARYSGLANTLDEIYNRMAESTYHSHEVSKALIEDFAELCRTNQIAFIVAGISSDAITTEMLEYCRSLGITTVDISVDLNIKENNNLPFDGHPSAVADQQYARKLWPVLCANLIDEPSCSR